jgi:hypothetical protein
MYHVHVEGGKMVLHEFEKEVENTFLKFEKKNT